ncbi:MFS transporter (plasmid) [Streptomyces sp. NBC_00435]|uniref:MFS transporter n=1 Tax=Streptomyces sp. NBC_00435 TaxID=2903649 RepID=UPI002E1CB25C
MTTALSRPEPAAESPAPTSALRRWLILFVVLSADFMDLLDGSIVNVAMPSIRDDLGGDFASFQWISAGYMLSFAVLLISGGRLGDVFGRKRMFLTGVAGFTVLSLVCGLATSTEMLIAGRVLQGAFAAVMVPQVIGIIRSAFPAKETAAAFAAVGPFMGLAAASGPVLGGVLINADLFGLGWRTIFLVNIPLGLLALGAASALLPESRSAKASRLDWTGMVLVSTAVLLLVYPLVQGREQGWPTWMFGMMLASVPAFGLFAWQQYRKQAANGSPLIVTSLLRKRPFVAGIAVAVLFYCAMAGYFLIFTLYMQIGLGYSAIRTGLTTVPWAVGIVVGAGIGGGFLSGKIGRKVIHIGLVIKSIGVLGILWVISHYGTDVTSLQISLPIWVCGVGMGFVVAPLFDIILAGVDDTEVGSASGLLSATQQLGSAVGVAILGTVFFGLLGGASGPAADSVTPALRHELTAAQVTATDQDRLLGDFRSCLHDSTTSEDEKATPASCGSLENTARQVVTSGEAGQQVGKAISESASTASKVAFTHSIKWVAWITVGLFGATFLLAFLLPLRARDEDEILELVATGSH